MTTIGPCIGSTVTSGAPLLFTCAQLRPSCGRLSGTLLPTSPLARMGPLSPAVATIGWLVLTLLVNSKHYFLCTLLCLLQFSILLRSEEDCCEYQNQRYQSWIDTHWSSVIYASKIFTGNRNNFNNSYETTVTWNSPFLALTTRAIFATTSVW